MIFGLDQENPGGTVFHVATISVFVCLLFVVLAVNSLCWFRRFSKRKMQELVRRVEEANQLLACQSVRMGCETINKLYFVFVLLEDCRQAFLQAPDGEALFQEALLRFLSTNVCCLVHAHFPLCEDTTGTQGHLELGLCICQFVSLQLKKTGGLG